MVAPGPRSACLRSAISCFRPAWPSAGSAVHDPVEAFDRRLVDRPAGEEVAPAHVAVKDVDRQREPLFGRVLRRGPAVGAEVEAGRLQVAPGRACAGRELLDALHHDLDAKLRLVDRRSVAIERRHAAAQVEAGASLEAEAAIAGRLEAASELALEVVEVASRRDENVARRAAYRPGAKGEMVMALAPSDPQQQVEHVAHGRHHAGIGAVGGLELDELRHFLVDIDARFFGEAAFDHR